MTAVTQAPARPAAETVSEDIFAAGIAKAATLPPMSRETAARLVPIIAAAIERNGGAR